MSTQGRAAHAAERQAWGRVPLVTVAGNALLLALNPLTVMRVQAAIVSDPRSPIDIIAAVDDALQDFCEEVGA